MSQSGSRLDVGVVGAGRVGTCLAQALAGAGHHVVAVSTASADHRERVEAALPGVAIVDEASVISQADLVLLAIPGDQIAAFVEGSAAAGVWHPGQIAVHTAPALGHRVLDPLAAQGVIPLAVSPTIAFSGTSIDVRRLRDEPMIVTAPPAVLPIAHALVIEMGGDPIEISDADRPVYAEAREVAGGFSRAIIDQAARLLREIEVADPAAVLRSVVTTSVADALDRSRWPDDPLNPTNER